MSCSILGDIEVAESNVDSSSSTATINGDGQYIKPMSHYRVLQLPRWLRRAMPKWNWIDRQQLRPVVVLIALLAILVACGILSTIIAPKSKEVMKLESLESTINKSLSHLARQVNASGREQSKAIMDGMKKVDSGLKSFFGTGLALLNTSFTGLSDSMSSMTHLLMEENAKLAVKLDNLTASVEEEKKPLISGSNQAQRQPHPTTPATSEVVEEVLEQLEEGIALEAKVINASTPTGQKVYIRWYALSRCTELVMTQGLYGPNHGFSVILKLKAHLCWKGEKNQIWTFGEGGVLKNGDNCLEEIGRNSLRGVPCHGHVTGYQQWKYDHEKQQLRHPLYRYTGPKYGKPLDDDDWGCLELNRADLESVDLLTCDDESLFQRWLLVGAEEKTSIYPIRNTSWEIKR